MNSTWLSPSENRAIWWIVLAVVVAAGLFLLGMLTVPTRANVSPIGLDALQDKFNKPVETAVGSPMVSPLVVTVYERVGKSGDNLLVTEIASTATVENVTPRADEIVDLFYNERLIVVKPQNWFVYTNNGVNFYLITNNVSNRTAQCDLDRQLIAVDFRLQTVDEPESAKNTSSQLQVACINYTLDNLIRLFGVNANKSYLDLSRYFDRKINPRAPLLVVDEVINYLLAHSLV